MAKKSAAPQLGTLLLVTPDGQMKITHSAKPDLSKIYELIGCDCVARIKVKLEGRARDCYLDDNGLIKRPLRFNPIIKRMAEDYYGQPCQEFAGNAVIWVPNIAMKDRTVN